MSIDKPKSNSVITTELIRHGDNVTGIKFKVKDAGETQLTLSTLHAKLWERAAIHGLIQKVSDAAALSRDTKTGKSASPQDKLSAMAKVVEHLSSGTEEWNLKREGGGGPSQDTVLLVKALMEVYPTKGEEAISKWVKARSVADRSALMTVEGPVKVIFDRLRGEAAKAVDTEALLSELEGIGEVEVEGSEPTEENTQP